MDMLDLMSAEEKMETPEQVEEFLLATKVLTESVFPDNPNAWPEICAELLEISNDLVAKEKMKKRVLEQHILSLQAPINEKPL